MMAAVLVAMSGCTSSDKNEQVGSVGNASADNSVPQSGAMVVTATKVATPAIPYSTPKPGNKFVTFDCSVKNVNAKDRYISLSDWKLRDTAGGIYSYSSSTFSSAITGFESQSNTQPGDIVKGLVVFELPQNATLKSLTYDDSYYTKVTFPL